MVVITSPDAIPAVRLAVDEYLQADLPEGYRYELVDGEVVMSPNPSGLHEEIIYSLNTILYEYCFTHRQSIALLSSSSGISIPGKDCVREPDLALYTDWEGQGRGWEVRKEFVPVLVIEVVSPDQEKLDYHEKHEDYFKAGINEHWIVDPHKGMMTILNRGADAWEDAVCYPGEAFESKRLPGLMIHVERVLSKRA